MSELDAAIASTRSHLLSLRNEQGHWEGYLSSSALSTATAIVALRQVDAAKHELAIARGAAWLVRNQNADGGWGDTTISKSNLSTTLLCWSALKMFGGQSDIENEGAAIDRANHWIASRVGSLDPEHITDAVVARYGKDKTFSVPILMLCAICGTLGSDREAWSRVLALPFELAALPRSWFGAVGLPVVSYALPALIAIGRARYVHAPPGKWNPLRLIRGALWGRIYPMLKTLQPSSGGYLEATPLTSFVTMALASSGDKDHPCVPAAVEFLLKSEREDGSWPIDTNLATWGTTLAVKALLGGKDDDASGADLGKELRPVRDWLLGQQYQDVHPFTNAAPGGWAWTNLPGGVPDADDTSGALIALALLCNTPEDRQSMLPTVKAGLNWLFNLQNRDGGIPTFCRGWGTLPFDRSTPEITAHALLACSMWIEEFDPDFRRVMFGNMAGFWTYLSRSKTYHERHRSLFWIPLWFGNEHAPDEDNRVFGTAQVVKSQVLYSGVWRSALGLHRAATGGDTRSTNLMVVEGVRYLLEHQHASGGWGGAADAPPSIEETALACEALAVWHASIPWEQWPREDGEELRRAIERGCAWLVETTRGGTHFPPAPIGLYFARLWYHEMIYPVVWSLGALRAAREVLARV